MDEEIKSRESRPARSLVPPTLIVCGTALFLIPWLYQMCAMHETAALGAAALKGADRANFSFPWEMSFIVKWLTIVSGFMMILIGIGSEAQAQQAVRKAAADDLRQSAAPEAGKALSE